MHKVKPLFIDLLALFIITAPAFIRILGNQYFSMHDDQHVARLFLLDQGLKQGYLYPRWVDGLGFGFGYPLYNFYPPLIYYLGEVFHLIGFSLVSSIKLVFISGFYLGALGIYLLVKKQTNRFSALLSTTLYTYFFYHAVLIYVRGALAEFISLAVLPFVFLSFHNLFERINWRNSILLGLFLAILVLSHPLIALPAVIFLAFFFLFYFYQTKNRSSFLKFTIIGGIIGIGLSAFFWLPSIIERKFTLTDQILTGELASYKLHYILPQQFYYSPWGYGGSGAGLLDGVTFQLGKIHIGLVILSIILFILTLIKNRKNVPNINYYLLSTFLLIFSLFMTTQYSSFIWDKFSYLWYLQFPWRFLTFTTVFISMIGAYSVYFMYRLLQQSTSLNKWSKLWQICINVIFIVFTIFTYQKYFKPQQFINTNDKERTSAEEIGWRISRTSYEFVPKGVKTKKTDLNTTTLAIEKRDVPKKLIEIISGQGNTNIIMNKFGNKIFTVQAESPLVFRLNTYNFPGWQAYLNNKQIRINDNNDLKLITILIPKGKYRVSFVFENTPIRNIANLLSVISLIFCLVYWKKFKKVDG